MHCKHVEVLSESIGNALQLTGGSEVEETAKFVLYFDKFFDILNVSNFTTWVQKRKSFQYPFWKGDDSRLLVKLITITIVTSIVYF